MTPQKKLFFSLSRKKIEIALRSNDVKINYGAYLFLCLSAPSIMATLPLGTFYEYVSKFFLVDMLIYFLVLSFGFFLIFSKEKENQVSTLKYCVCNYPGLYFICYLIFKPFPYYWIGLVYFLGLETVISIEEKYVNSDFLKWFEIVMTAALHASVSYLLALGYRAYKRKHETDEKFARL